MTQASVQSYSALRGTQREFEITMILRPDSNKEAIADLVGRVQKLFARDGGRMQKIDNWGLRTLAYPIEGQKKGIYLYVRFLGGSDTVRELERNLRIWDGIVRYLTVVVDEDVDPGARPSDVDDETLDAASDVAPDPLEIEAEKRAALAAQDAAEKAEAEKAEAEKAEAKKPEAKKSEGDKAEAKKTEAEKPEAKKTEAKKTEADKSEAKASAEADNKDSDDTSSKEGE